MTSRSSSLPWIARGSLAAAALCVGGYLVACGGSSEQTGTADAKLPEGVRSENVEHEACTESGNKVESLDANGDGKADIRRVYDKGTNREVCRITDLNHDGKPDMFEYYDPAGNLRRREADYDDSGVVDAIEYFEGGKLVRRELDTSGQHRIDTWDYFDPATGKRIKRERDATGDGRVDQWWTWSGDQVTIAFDKNNDGKPDPADTLVLGANGTAVAPPVADAGAPVAPVASPSSDAGGPTLAPAPDTSSAADAGAAKSTKGTTKSTGGAKK